MNHDHVSVLDILSMLTDLENLALEEKNTYATYLLSQAQKALTTAFLTAYNK